MKKVYLENRSVPWVTWAVELWKVAQTMHTETIDDIKFVSYGADADVGVLEYTQDLNYEDGQFEKVIFYIEEATKSELDEFTTKHMPCENSICAITDNYEVYNNLKKTGFNVCRWYRPTRIPAKMALDNNRNKGNLPKKDGGFVITCNGQQHRDNLAEILKTYFAMCLIDDPEHEGELICMQDVEIFSAQELPFETFNNVHFHGLQPNPHMFRAIRKAKLFISPYNGGGYSINAVDAVNLGTPVLLRDTMGNRTIFNYDERNFFKDEEELAQRIKYFSEIDVDDPEYIELVKKGWNKMSITDSSVSVRMLITIILNMYGLGNKNE